jgi:murein DD-endopeptidase MepM/ murein hydrolase activator NlpD
VIRALASIATTVLACMMTIVAAGAADSAPAPRPLPAPGTDLVVSGELQQGGWIRGTVPRGTTSLMLGEVPVGFAPDGAFLIAFDRDAAPRAVLTARRADGSAVTRELAIAPRGWKIEHINAARRPGGATEAFLALRRPELARINAARAKSHNSSGWRQSFIWPVKGRISGMFGSQRVYRGEPGAYHSGIDIATGGSGTPFVAPADGVVILAAKEPFTLEGHLLMIDHGMGLNSAFLHCSELLVEEGDRVRQGQLIGRIGATGRATGPHLHWGMKWNDARIDPILLTGPMK